MCSEVISKTHKANRTYFEHKLALISAIISLSQCMSDSCCDACFMWRCSIINVNDLSGVMMAGDNFVPLKTTCDSWLISEMFTVQINLLQMEPGVDTTLRCRPRGWTQSRQINKKFKQLSRERQPVVSAGISFSSFFLHLLLYFLPSLIKLPKTKTHKILHVSLVCILRKGVW